MYRPHAEAHGQRNIIDPTSVLHTMAETGAGAGAGAGAGSGAGSGGAGSGAEARHAEEKAILDGLRAVSSAHDMGASYIPVHLGAFSPMGSGKSTLLNMLFNACGATGPFTAGTGSNTVDGAKTTHGLRGVQLAAETEHNSRNLPIIFDCPGTPASSPLDYFAHDLQNLFWGYYKQGETLRYSANAISRGLRGGTKLVLGKTSVFPMRDNMIDAFLCCVDVDQFCSDTNITILDEGELVVPAGSPLGQLCAQVRSLREKASNSCCNVSPILAFTKWRGVDSYLREKDCSEYVVTAFSLTERHIPYLVGSHLRAQVDDFKRTLRQSCGAQNQLVFFINSAEVCDVTNRLTAEQKRDAQDLLVALTKSAIRANQGRVDTYRGRMSWGKDKKSACAVL